jgi:phage terminase large subunit
LGKDRLAAPLALWWVYSRRGYVLITGPTERQVKHVVMGHVRRAFNAAADLPGHLYELALRLDGSEEMGILAFTSTDASKLTGFHAPRLTVIVTEARGIEDLVWEGVFANVTGEQSKILAVGNPLQPTGKFYEVARWLAVKIAATEHPNVVDQRELVPGAVGQSFIDQMADEYGVGSGVYQSRVLGEFPEDSDEALCQRPWVRAANERWAALPRGLNGGKVELALDPAQFGPDFSALAIRCGDAIEEIVTWSKLSTVETATRTLVELDRIGLDKSHGVTVDEPGVGGGVIDVLRERGATVRAYNGGKPAVGRKANSFRNLRAQAFWNIRRRLERGDLALPPDEKLSEELCSMRWSIATDGKVEIEPKEALRARLGRSPDRADAVAMCFAGDGRPPRWVAGIRFGRDGDAMITCGGAA